MAMTPEEKREFEELKRIVNTLVRVENVPFIESAKRRVAIPAFESLGITEIISKDANGTASGLSQTVDESGASSYGVAKEYAGSLTVADQNGNLYKLGYYAA